MAMAMLGAMTTQNVVALGLGEIELKSALNQPLVAEVELLSATPSEIGELKVEIASSQAFENAGIDRPLFLTRLNFNVEKNAAGQSVVMITSRDVVREPFLDFLLELSWSKGKLLREYTVLVDPPVTMAAPAPVLQAPAARVQQVQAVPAQPAQRVQHTALMPPVSVAPSQYRTQRNDTLWKVAEAVRPDAGVSMDQTMLGLLHANPDAFYEGNINNLKAGYILRVPSRDEMTAINQTAARRETRAQYQAWRQARSAPGTTGAEQTVAGQSSTADQVAPAKAPAEAQLQLVSPDLSTLGSAGGSAEDAGKLDALQRDLMMANEALEAQRRQSEDMSGRVAVLEEQIRNMQRLITLKDDQLAQMQAQVGGESESAVAEEIAAPAEVEQSTAAEEVSPADADAGLTAVADGALSEQGADAAAVSEEATEVPVAEDTAEGEMPVPVPAPLEDVIPVQPEAPESVVADAAGELMVPETATTPGFVEQIMANPLWLGAGGVLLALLAFFGLRRKRGTETGFEESILQASQNIRSTDSGTGVESSVASGESNETSLLSEFAVSDMGSIKQGGEADPLAEADVYLAYGRFQQAEDLVSEALENDTDDEDLNLKLLEIFLAAQNQTGFDAHAQSLLGRLTQSGEPLWEKISEMGRELNPDNPMYQAGGAAVEDALDYSETDFSETDEDLGVSNKSTEFDTESFTGEATKAADEDDKGLDFDIDLSYSAAEIEDDNALESVQSVADDTADLEFDMGTIESDSMKQDNALDFDLEGMDLGSDDELESDLGDGELTDLDEVSTKLDLARAYIDMGDPDGAKSILDEVLEEGSDDQKNEAQGIMEQIS